MNESAIKTFGDYIRILKDGHQVIFPLRDYREHHFTIFLSHTEPELFDRLVYTFNNKYVIITAKP